MTSMCTPMDPNTPPVERTTAQSVMRGRTLRPSTLPVNGVDVPRDRDREIDWKQSDETFGTPN